MNNSGVRSAVRVIRLDEFVPKQAVMLPERAVDELEPEWSSLPSLAWPEPIGSARPRTPVLPDPVEDDGLDPVLEEGAPTVPTSTAFETSAAASSAPGKMPRLPNGVVTSWPLRFQGEPLGYARLWLRNLLLILLTAGLYLPWARVRSQRYLMRHTKVAGHVLDYHEPPGNLLPRYALSAALMLGVTGAWAGGSTLAGMLALSLALAVWPLLVFMSLTHRMAHLSWAHRRLAFDGTCQQVYRAMWAPLFGGGAVAWLLMAAVIVRSPGNWVAWGAALGLWVLAMPAFVWTWYVFRQRHLRLGPLHLLWKASKPAVMMMFLRTLVWAMLATVFSLGVAAVVLAGVLVMRGKLNLTIERGLLLASALAVCAAVQPYAQARLQNLVWNKSGNRYLRFRSKLSVADFVMLQSKHALLLVLTLGLYWPWAVIATRRMRAQSLTIWSRVDADVLKAHWPTYEAPATGKMAGSPANL
ncbi:MAG TPA: DUF898 family protein [Aquabacterium sp.]|uniref:DUF898 family protein n=1 Tax=Aquabacterium sp. TaxID=1872578 RepID=UPI002E34592D|nr:DUF898 family protein [Aquabacterium sp.]HEX5357493.1 DUF898 family protein [Aquabacterium sp.]